MTVPEGKRVYVGRNVYKAGDELPKGVKIREQGQGKKSAPAADKKKEEYGDKE